MVKKVLIVFGLLALIATMAFGYRKASYDLPLARLKAIQKPGLGQDSYRMVIFQNMVFPTGDGEPGIDPKVTNLDHCTDPELAPYYNHLRDRARWLKGLESPNFSAIATSMTFLSKGKVIRGQNFECFGVDAIEVTDAQGRKKLRATGISPMSSCHSGEPGKPIAYPKKDIARREDFVNPEDVDWLLGVPDFSTFGKIKTEVR